MIKGVRLRIRGIWFGDLSAVMPDQMEKKMKMKKTVGLLRGYIGSIRPSC